MEQDNNVQSNLSLSAIYKQTLIELELILLDFKIRKIAVEDRIKELEDLLAKENYTSPQIKKLKEEAQKLSF